MQAAVRLSAKVLPGHRIEVVSPDLPDGANVEVIVMLDATPRKRRSMRQIAESLAPGPRPFSTWEAYEQFLAQERAAWER